MINKCKRFFQETGWLKVFFLLHFLIIVLSLTTGRYYHQSWFIRFCTRYQAYFFTQNWKLFAHPPLKFRCYVKDQSRWMEINTFLKKTLPIHRRQVLQLGFYNTFHQMIYHSAHPEAFKAVELFFKKNIGFLPESLCILSTDNYVLWGFKKQNSYLWHIQNF